MKHRTHRREFLAVTAAGAWLALGRGAYAAPAQAAAWSDQFPQLLGRIKAPVFAKRDFDITKYGAKPGVETDSSEAQFDCAAVAGALLRVVASVCVIFFCARRFSGLRG